VNIGHWKVKVIQEGRPLAQQHNLLTYLLTYSMEQSPS